MSFPLPQVEKSRNDKVKVTRRDQVKVTHLVTTAVYTQLLMTLCIINPTPENATKVKPALDAIMCRIHDGALANCTAEDLAEPGKHLCLGRNYKDYLNVDLFTAKREFDFREAFPRSIVVEVVHGIPARIASEGDLKILDSLRQQSERAGLEWRHAVESFFVRTK